MSNVTYSGLPVPGYRAQDEATVAKVRELKIAEERVLRILDLLKADADIDQRWLQMGRSSIEQGFMAATRAVCRPARVELSE